MPKTALSAGIQQENAIHHLRQGLSASDSEPKCVISLGSKPPWTLLSYYPEGDFRKNTLNHDGPDPNTAITGSDHLLHEQSRPNISGVLPPATPLTMIPLKA
jgi:hypothetical protein